MQKLLDHIRKRPGMYIGKIGNGSSEHDGIYTLLRRVLNSFICQLRSHNNDEIRIDIRDSRSVTVVYRSAEIEYIEIIQALSSAYDISIYSGISYLSFTLDETIFKGFSYDEAIVSKMLKSYCYANKGLIIRYNDVNLSAPNGLADLISQVVEDESCQYPVIHLSHSKIEVAFTNKCNRHDKPIYYSFVNGVQTKGGSHQRALENALIKAIGNVFWDKDICPSEIIDGLSAAISIDIADPIYEQANPENLATFKLSPEGPDIREFVCNFLSDELSLYLKQHPEVKGLLLSHFTEHAMHM